VRVRVRVLEIAALSLAIGLAPACDDSSADGGAGGGGVAMDDRPADYDPPVATGNDEAPQDTVIL
jgi:hypothetical protein